MIDANVYVCSVHRTRAVSLCYAFKTREQNLRVTFRSEHVLASGSQREPGGPIASVTVARLIKLPVSGGLSSSWFFVTLVSSEVHTIGTYN